MSYDTVVSVVERTTGSLLVCSQTLCHWVQDKAALLDAALIAEVAAASVLPAPALAEVVDIYDPQAKEVLVFCDGIGVKAQKPTHEKAGEPRREKPDKRYETDVMLFEGQDARFRYLSGSTDKQVGLADVAGAYLRTEWGEHSPPVPIVALTDGAKKIRQDLATVFGCCVTVILDWYHLAKRVYEHLSMCAHSRAEREEWEHTILGFLWQGQVSEALSFLLGVSARNGKALAELIGYLEKHTSEIIDYGRRKATGKPIGSGRMEKAVDQVIGIRQKKKGMSWSKQGSHALALLKIAELNGQWHKLWTPPVAA